jgi:hypothetical protein
MKGALSREVRQSLSLILWSAVGVATYVGLGLLAMRVLG